MKPFWKFMAIIFLLVIVVLPVAYIMGWIEKFTFGTSCIAAAMLMVLSVFIALPER